MRTNFAPFLLAAASALTGVVAAPRAVEAQTTETVLTSRTFIDVAKRVMPAVVSIQVVIPPSDQLLEEANAKTVEEFWENLARDPRGLELFRRFDMEEYGATGAGSGAIIDVREGWAYVVTNDHVLMESDRVRYTVNLDHSYKNEPFAIDYQDVEVVGSDPLTDLAVVRFRAPEDVELKTMAFADSDRLEVGEWVLALGNPLELNNSVSQGIISGKNRVIYKTPIENLIQTTAVINPGNSGGPLVNLDGDIVGVNNAIATATGRWAGVGFAIPGNEARRISTQLIEQGRVTRGYLGIVMDDLTNSVARIYELGEDDGVVVTQVQSGSPAESHGVEIGDIVTAVQGIRVRSKEDLLRTIGGFNANEKVEITLIRFRGNTRQEKSVQVTLTERPSEEELMKMATRQSEEALMNALPSDEGEGLSLMEETEGSKVPALGLSIEPFELGGMKGLRVFEVKEDGPAGRAGITTGDVLLSINGFRATDLASLEEGLTAGDPTKDHVVLFSKVTSFPNGVNRRNEITTVQRQRP